MLVDCVKHLVSISLILLPEYYPICRHYIKLIIYHPLDSFVSLSQVPLPTFLNNILFFIFMILLKCHNFFAVTDTV